MKKSIEFSYDVFFDKTLANRISYIVYDGTKLYPPCTLFNTSDTQPSLLIDSNGNEIDYKKITEIGFKETPNTLNESINFKNGIVDYSYCFIFPDPPINEEMMYKMIAVSGLSNLTIHNSFLKTGLNIDTVYSFYCMQGRFPNESECNILIDIGFINYYEMSSLGIDIK